MPLRCWLLAAAACCAVGLRLPRISGNCRADSDCREGYLCKVPPSGGCADGAPLLSRGQDCGARPACCEGRLKCVPLALTSHCKDAHFDVGRCMRAHRAVDMPSRKYVDNHNGLQVSYLERGRQGNPLVLFLHGFPELSDSWRPQLDYFGARGFWAVAPDLRGYGETTGSSSVASLEVLNLVNDTVGLIRALNVTSAVLVGHDVGAVPAFFASQLHPDMVRGVVLASLPFGLVPPLMDADPFAQEVAFEQLLASVGMVFSQAYLRTRAEEDIAADPAAWLRKAYYVGSSEGGFHVDVAARQLYPIAYPAGSDFFALVPGPVPEQPKFGALLDRQARFFRSGGAHMPLAYYNITYFDVQQIFTGPTLKMPYYFIAGEHEFVNGYDFLEAVPGFAGKGRVSSSGHWFQHENPNGTNQVLEIFLNRFL